MENLIPWHRELKFDNKIFEITSITFEHDYKIAEFELNGTFVISGEYRISEISVNKEKFEFKLPFNIELNNDFDLDTVELEITDFNYIITGNDEISVDIEMKVKAEKIKETNTDDIFKEVDDDLRMDADEIIEDMLVIEPEKIKEDQDMVIDDELEVLETEAEIKEGFIKYHVHIIKEKETIEEIALMYQTTIMDIEKYNNITTLNIGDKLIIPSINE